MIRVRLAIPLLAGVALAVYSCGGPSSRSRSASLVTAPSLAKASGTCDVSTLLSLARSYFSTPEQQTTTDTLRAMQTECGNNEGTQVVAGGWTILSAMDTIAAARTGGSAADGASLANGVMTYMCSFSDLCTPAPTTSDTVALVTAADLDTLGMFAVRDGGSTDIVAHGKVSFDNDANAAQWGVQTTTTWPQATGESTILLYGAPGTLPPIGDVSIGDLAYRLHTFPRVPQFTGSQLEVGVCYDQDVILPSPDTANVLQRNGTLLQTYVPSFGDCRQPVASRNGSGGLFALLRRAFLPQPLAASSGPPSTGGSPINFSHFAPVGANPAGRLQFVTPPVDGVNGQSLPLFTVAALSGGGTAIERVPIMLYLSTNNGVPAGASFCNTDGTACSDTTAMTKEAVSGYGTVATFTGVTIYKAGGYELCATAASVTDEQGVPITFQDVCATIHIKNN